MPRKSLISLIPLILIVSACASIDFIPRNNPPPFNTPTSSPQPLATAISEEELTSDAAQTASMLVTPPLPTSVVASPSPGVTITPTDTPIPLVNPDTIIPEGEIQIYVPGELSKLSSPFQFVANLTPSPNNTVLIELLGEDGRTLTRKIILAFPPGSATRTNAVTEIQFEIDSFSELGRLVVSVEDEYGRIHALASVSVILISSGITLLNPYVDNLENIIIQQPSANFMVRGDTLIVTGIARTQSDRLLVVELIDREGRVMAFASASVVRDEGQEYGFFATELTYEIVVSTWVLIVVKELGERIAGTVHISSLEMVISP